MTESNTSKEYVYPDGSFDTPSETTKQLRAIESALSLQYQVAFWRKMVSFSVLILLSIICALPMRGGMNTVSAFFLLGAMVFLVIALVYFVLGIIQIPKIYRKGYGKKKHYPIKEWFYVSVVGIPLISIERINIPSSERTEWAFTRPFMNWVEDYYGYAFDDTTEGIEYAHRLLEQSSLEHPVEVGPYKVYYEKNAQGFAGGILINVDTGKQFVDVSE